MPRAEVAHFFASVADVARDPLTGLPPSCEVELSAVFVYQQARGDIDWSRVAPRFVDARIPNAILTDALRQPGLMLAEYPLFSAPGLQTDRWGEMRADAMYVSNDRRIVVMFEAKVDSYFTYGERPPDAQLSRQLEYLASVDGDMKGLVLLSPDFNVDWYFERLSRCWKELRDRDRVFACVAKWEEILGAG